MIRGFFRARNAPYISCQVILPRLGIEHQISFLLDTGADSTCLHPSDAQDLGIPFDMLQDESISRGIGGGASYYRESALLEFRDGPIRSVYDIQLLIAKPTEDNSGFPSLLGRNIISRWSVLYEPINGRLECRVLDADFAL